MAVGPAEIAHRAISLESEGSRDDHDEGSDTVPKQSGM